MIAGGADSTTGGVLQEYNSRKRSSLTACITIVNVSRITFGSAATAISNSLRVRDNQGSVSDSDMFYDCSRQRPEVRG
jgi:hypothetical protein